MPPSSFTSQPHDLFVQLTDVAPFPVLIVDSKGRLLAENAAARALLPDPLALLDQHVPAWREKLRSHPCAPAQLCVPTSAGHITAYTMLATPLEAPASPVARFALRLIDCAALKEHILTVLTAAATACFDARSEAEFCRALEKACSSLTVSAALILPDQGTPALRWMHVPAATHPLFDHLDKTAAWEAILTRAATPQPANSAPTIKPITCPQPALETPASAAFALLWGDQCLTIPLWRGGTPVGSLVVAAHGLREADAAVFAPLGSLFRRLITDIFVQPVQNIDHLIEAGRAITAAHAIDDILRVTCEYARQMIDGATTAILLPEPDSPALRCHMASGTHSDALLGRRWTLDEDALDHLFKQQRRVLIQQMSAADPDARSFADDLVPGVFQPLFVQQRTLGILVIAHTAPEQMTLHECSALDQLSAIAAIALENAHLHETTRLGEERYRTLFQNAFEIMLTLDATGRIISWNGAALRFLGLSPAEMSGAELNIYDLVAPNAAAQLRHMQQETLHGHAVPIEIEIQGSTGNSIVELTMQVMHETGRPPGMYIVGRNMTERRREQHALAEQVAQLRALHLLSSALSTSLDRGTIVRGATAAIVEASQFECAGVFLADPAGDLLRLAAGTGFDAAELLIADTPPTKHLYPNEATARPTVYATAAMDEPLRSLFLSKNVAHHAYLPLVGPDDLLGLLVVGRADNALFSEDELRVLQTMARQLGQALQNIALYSQVEQSAARYRDLYENANDFIGTMTAEGAITSLNHAALAFFGYTRADLPTLHLRQLLPPERQDSVQQVLQTLFQPAALTHELEVVRRGGSCAVLELRSRLISGGDDPQTVHFIARDLTERRKLEIHARQTEKLASLGQLVAGAAHELNNPLAVVLGSTQLLLRDPATARFADDIRNIETAAQRAKQIVSHMLTFAREQSDTREAIRIDALVEELAASYTPLVQQAEAQLEVTIAADVPAIEGDPHQLMQVLDNMLQNAMQAIAQKEPPSRKITVAVERVEHSVQIQVRDTGPGIAPDVLPRIFDPFFTTRDVGQGTGLGLSLVYGIIEKHGGTVRAESIYGNGATFTITLPAPQTQAVTTSNTMIEALTSSILVVEDEPDVRTIVERALTRHGYVVDAVNNAEAAIHRVASKHYDLLITDMRMPGMSGKELFDRIHGLYPRTRWVFITGDLVSTQSEDIQQQGVPFLVKPFTLDELWNAVASSMLDTQPV